MLHQLGKIFSDFSLFFFLVIIVVAGQLSNPLFLSPATIYTIIRGTACLGFLALGEVLVIISRGIDLSVGQIACLSSVIVVYFMIMFQSPLIAIVLTLLMGLGFGVLSGTLVNIGIPPFLATLGTMWIAQGLAEYLGVKPTPVPSHFSSFNIISFETPPVTAIILILISVISLEILATKVPIGRYIYYVGGNEYGTYISGVDVKLIKYIIYSFSGFSASIGGILLTSWTTSGYKWVALGQEFTAIAASVIGGASLAGGEGRVFKTIIAMVLLITISSLYTFLGLPPTLFFLTEGFLILGAALFQIKFRRG